jgi:hypothetical protein
MKAYNGPHLPLLVDQVNQIIIGMIRIVRKSKMDTMVTSEKEYDVIELMKAYKGPHLPLLVDQVKSNDQDR